MIPGSPATASMRRLLTELGESGRTGALHIGGVPGGVLYLITGRISYAESPACPGLGERLVSSGRLARQTWRAVYAEGRGGHRVGRVLLRDGWLGRNELSLRVATVIADAAHVLLQQADAPAHFVPGERHWLGEVPGVELGSPGHLTAARLRAVPGPRRPRKRVTATGP
ncbi:DUF4388 domain-containing protein [Actinoplanes flavus]|uniref:PatA-like N-terminal domain-containing protein n=1 Tax=Actinoplanes flavus TaxID=2820290 RepID=A0ABS3UHU3_9ACTN|nr:DUF4388 domain-containing protein [Actinoplanes flavus]MBO3738321.1 hypothetical protein [Actinoplanes flavus]